MTSAPPEVYRRTVTPFNPASPPFTVPLLSLSLQIRLPSETGWNRPKSTLRFELASASPSLVGSAPLESVTAAERTA